jgi:glutaminyl-tRNA synthetase
MISIYHIQTEPGPYSRKVPFSRVLYIEQEDFREDPPKQFYRLAPGREVRLRYAYFITCKDVLKNPGSSGSRVGVFGPF